MEFASKRGFSLLAEAMPSAESIRDQLRKIVSSRGVIQSKRLVRFLSFVVEWALEGKRDQLSEYLIGVEVYERPSSFDPQIDTIVRGEARRLRLKLRRYYETDGANDPIVIEIPKGAYAPTFHQRDRGILDKNIGQLLSHYRLLEKLGEGGMGSVYLAGQPSSISGTNGKLGRWCRFGGAAGGGRDGLVQGRSKEPGSPV